MNCPGCGSEIADESVSCGQCGHSLAGGVEVPLDRLRRPVGVTVLAVLDFIGGLFYLMCVVLLPLAGSLPGGFGLSVFFLIVAALFLITGYGMWTLSSYGRILQLVLAWIGLLGFPLITVISILILIYLYQPAMRVLFSGKGPDELSADEAQALMRSGASPIVFVLVGMLGLVVAIVLMGFVAAIAVPNFLHALNLAKQKRTMANIEVVGREIESYSTLHNTYPTATSMDELQALLKLDIGDDSPTMDAWGRPILVQSRPTGYVLCSSGRDGGGCEMTGDGGPTTGFNDAIIYANGQFVQWPERFKPIYTR
jgi:type II secretory pathway pseudopilin PulG